MAHDYKFGNNVYIIIIFFCSYLLFWGFCLFSNERERTFVIIAPVDDLAIDSRQPCKAMLQTGIMFTSVFPQTLSVTTWNISTINLI